MAAGIIALLSQYTAPLDVLAAVAEVMNVLNRFAAFREFIG